jgi:hypothetical protein
MRIGPSSGAEFVASQVPLWLASPGDGVNTSLKFEDRRPAHQRVYISGTRFLESVLDLKLNISAYGSVVHVVAWAGQYEPPLFPAVANLYVESCSQHTPTSFGEGSRLRRGPT